MSAISEILQTRPARPFILFRGQIVAHQLVLLAEI